MPEKKFDGTYKSRREQAQLREIQIFNIAYEQLKSEIINNLQDIIELYNECFARANRDRSTYEWLFDYVNLPTGERKSKVTKSFLNRTALHELNTYVSQFCQNTLPKHSNNFCLSLTEAGVIRAQNSVYFGESKETVKKNGNTLLKKISDTIQEAIDNSDFYTIFESLVKGLMIRQFECLLIPIQNSENSQGNIFFKQILPFSIAYDYDDKNRVIGVYRTFRMRVKDIAGAYPDIDGEFFRNRKSRDVVQFKECCFLKYIPMLNKTKWVFVLITDDCKLSLLRILDFNPYITFHYTLPEGSNVGYGKLFELYDDIQSLERLEKFKMDVLHRNAHPMYEADIDCFVKEQLKSLKKLEPGMIIHVNGNKSTRPRSIIPISAPIDVMPYREEIQAHENNIRKCISGEVLTIDPNATATLTVTQTSQRVAYLKSHYGEILAPFIHQMVQKVFLSEKRLGLIQSIVKSFLTEDMANRLPSEIFGNLIHPRTEEEMILLNDMLDEFIDTFLEIIGDFSSIEINITSPIGSMQKLEDLNKMTSGLQTISQALNIPIQNLINSQKFISIVSEAMGIDREVLLELEDIKENQAAMIKEQIAMQQQQAA